VDEYGLLGVRQLEEGDDRFLRASRTAWTAAARRPGLDHSYTQNWPQESLVGNQITPLSHLWSILSIVLLILGVGLMVWFQASQKEEPFPDPRPIPAAPAASPFRADGCFARPGRSAKRTARTFQSLLKLERLF